MFDVVLYPVSAVLWFWHRVFGSLLGPDSGQAWVLAIVFLVFTVRALLIRPALSQLRAARTTQHLAPRVQRIRKTHSRDRARMAEEIQKLHAAHDASPLGGCLPALIQIPAFLGLFWVLRGFTPDAPSNQVFDRSGVESFLGADLFGATLGNWISQPAAELAAFGTDRPHLIAVGVPLMLAAGLATFLSMRRGLGHTTATTAQLATLGRLMTYLAPVGLLVSGLFFPIPIGVLWYFLASNLWTLGQQRILTAMIDRGHTPPDATPHTAPRPGQKPQRPTRRRTR